MRNELGNTELPEFNGQQGEPIIKSSRVCYVDRLHPNTSFLRLRKYLGCPCCGFPGGSADDYEPLKCIYSAYNGVWNPVSKDASQNPKRQVKKYCGPYRWLVPLLILRLNCYFVSVA